MDQQQSVRWRMAMLSHVGRVRVRNEDYVCCSERLGLAVLTDGMGGHVGGAVASRLAAEAWMAYMQMVVAQGAIDEGELRAAVAVANQSVFDEAQRDPFLRQMGTTLVGICLPDSCDRLLACHVGDSRIYRWRNDVLDCLTRDHSVLREQCDAGMIDPLAPGPVELRGLLTRAVGVAACVEADVADFPLQDGDIYLLCSDGVTDMLPDTEIADVLGALGGAPRLAAEHLIDLANDRGGVDNVSVVIVSSRRAGRLGTELD
ncbi:MAG: serine/threonine-protein phosphatase [Proteobacteria bacterium]|nr:serine/threonine-protein phosphatase [Pseudomonadota bacterium]RTL34802.1 MAG: serine/threonine-protein phosphatase [Rhodocyclaceae bacterium]